MSDLDFHAMLQNLYIREFSVTFWSELASILFPDRFFVIDKSLFEAIDSLLERGLIPAERFPVLASRRWGTLWNDLDEYVAGRSRRDDEVRGLCSELRSVVDTILGYLREVEPTADYLDVDSFLRFIHMAKGGTVRDDYAKEVRDAFGGPPGIVLNDWLEHAKKECESSDPCGGVDEGMVKEIVLALRRMGQVVLYGVPGIGKTFVARCIAEHLTKGGSGVEFVTFHPSYNYEEFIEGIRPRIVERDGVKLMEFYIEHGVFKRASALATCDLLKACGILARHPDLGVCDMPSGGGGAISHGGIDVDSVFERVAVNLEMLRKEIREVGLDRCMGESVRVLVIDEINRGDVARVFGELITLLERDKRLFGVSEIVVRLPYSKKPFFVPPNLYVVGTMNSADRSIAFVDYALRRRFAFVELEPDKEKVPDRVSGLEGFDLRAFFERLNEYLEKEIDRDHRIGHSYFMGIRTVSDLKAVWFTQIRPLLMEYFYGRDDDVASKLEELYTRPYIESDEEFRRELENALMKLGG